MNRPALLQISLFVLFLCCCLHCKPNRFPQIAFDCVDYNFGEIHGIDTLLHEFRFKNTGSKGLSINDVKTECGCTVVNWTHGIIKQSCSGRILIKYKTSFPIDFKEIIYVYYDGMNSPTKLSVEGRISP
jgi:hypothetical protein